MERCDETFLDRLRGERVAAGEGRAGTFLNLGVALGIECPCCYEVCNVPSYPWPLYLFYFLPSPAWKGIGPSFYVVDHVAIILVIPLQLFSRLW